MAADAPSAGSGGSRGIDGGRDRVRKSLYAADESSFRRPAWAPGMPAALIGDQGLATAWVRTELADRRAIAVIPP
ncbi:MAG: hypothetical protein ACREC9_07345 [Methylocella sp.]